MKQPEIKITGDIYANSPEEFKAIKLAALKLGYKGKELTSHPENKSTGRGQFLVMGAPNFERKGKCGYCNSLISIYGIYGHNRKCEVCNKLIYKNYKKGDLITFFFRDNSSVWDDITLRVHSMDEKKYIMRFEPVIPRLHKYGKQNKKKTLEILEQNKDSYTRVQIGKKLVYSFYYTFNGGLNELSKINTSSTRNHDGNGKGGFQKCSAVNIMFGKEYSEFSFKDEYPMPETFHLYRDWKVEKTGSEIARRAGITSRPEYYSGRDAGDINSKHLKKMYDMIKSFKGEDAAKGFVEMIKGTDDMSATSLMIRYNRLERNGWSWNPEWNEKQKERGDSNIALDVNNPLQMYATVISAFSNGRGIMKTMKDFGIISDDFDTFGDSIKYEFLNSIK